MSDSTLDEPTMVNSITRQGSSIEFNQEKARIASRLIDARFDDGGHHATVIVDEHKMSYINIRFALPVELIAKDLEGMPEIIKIIWGYPCELISIEAHPNAVLDFGYRLILENTIGVQKND